MSKSVGCVCAFILLACCQIHAQAGLPSPGAPASQPGNQEVLAEGIPPLTGELAGKACRFYEWVLDVSLTQEQRRELQEMLKQAWRNKNKDNIELMTLYIAQLEPIEKLDPAKRDLAREQIQPKLLALWKTQDDDAICRWALAVHEQAHKPIAEGSPPLTRQIADASLEVLCFSLSEALGGPRLEPERAVREFWANRLAAGYKDQDADQKKILANVPTMWAALRAGWPELSDAQKAETRRQWKEYFAAGIAAIEAAKKGTLPDDKSIKAVLVELAKEAQAEGDKLTGPDAEAKRAELLARAEGQYRIALVLGTLTAKPGQLLAAAPRPDGGSPAGQAPTEVVTPDARGAFPAIDALTPDAQQAALKKMNDPARIKPGFVVGAITDARGQPIKNATLSAWASGTTMAGRHAAFNFTVAEDGTFSQRVPDGVYDIGATVQVKVQGVWLRYDAEPIDGAHRVSLDSSAGIVRDFRWRLTGVLPGRDGKFDNEYYGASLLLAEPNVGGGGQHFGQKYPGGTVELLLTPRGPLADGSKGRTYRFTCKAEQIDFLSPSPAACWNIAQGQYTATATITRGGTSPLKLSAAGDGPAAASLEVEFPVQDERFKQLRIFVRD